MDDDGKALVLELTKEAAEWWSCVRVGDPQIDTTKIEPPTGKLSDLDAETRSQVEKMMFDQRQQQLGKPSSEELKREQMLKKLQEKNPGMDFSQAKWN